MNIFIAVTAKKAYFSDQMRLVGGMANLSGEIRDFAVSGGQKMAGGRRAGAGRPKGGISELSRILQDGGVDGLADVGAELGLDGSREERAQFAVRSIVKDWARADPAALMKFFGSITAQKSADAEGESPLIQALKRAPGMIPDAGESPALAAYSVELSKAGDSGACAADSKSAACENGRFFHAQLPFDSDAKP